MEIINNLCKHFKNFVWWWECSFRIWLLPTRNDDSIRIVNNTYILIKFYKLSKYFINLCLIVIINQKTKMTELSKYLAIIS